MADLETKENEQRMLNDHLIILIGENVKLKFITNNELSNR